MDRLFPIEYITACVHHLHLSRRSNDNFLSTQIRESGSIGTGVLRRRTSIPKLKKESTFVTTRNQSIRFAFTLSLARLLNRLFSYLFTYSLTDTYTHTLCESKCLLTHSLILKLFLVCSMTHQFYLHSLLII